MINETMGNVNDNIFIDYKNIDPDVIIDPHEQFALFDQWFYWENDKLLILNEYNTIKNNKIRLYIVVEEIFETEPIIFQNSIQIINNKFILKINNIKSVMHNIQPINFAYFNEEDDGYNYYDKYDCQRINKICDKYNVKCECAPFDNYIYDNYAKELLVVCKQDHENICFVMLDNYFFSNKQGRISCNPVKVINNDKIIRSINF